MLTMIRLASAGLLQLAVLHFNAMNIAWSEAVALHCTV